MIINEDNFIMHLLNRDEKALSYVIDVYGGLIKSIVNKDLYNLESYKDECINDILLAVWDGIDKYDKNKGSFKYWLAAITKYKCIGYKRKYLNIKLIEENLDFIELESEEFDSIGGYIIGYIKHIPEENELIEVDGIKFNIESVDKNRIKKIRILL